MDKLEYNPGESIKGNIVLMLKKPVDSKGLFVGLIGEEKNTRYERNHDGKMRRKSEHEIIFEFKKPIDSSRNFSIGEKSYDFSLKIPENLLSKSLKGNKVVDTLVQSVQILAGSSSSVKWYVVANLDIKGFDVSKKIQINIG